MSEIEWVATEIGCVFGDASPEKVLRAARPIAARIAGVEQMSDLYTKGYRIGRRDTEARLAARIEALETALREIAAYGDFPCKSIARAALAPEQEK